MSKTRKSRYTTKKRSTSSTRSTSSNGLKGFIQSAAFAKFYVVLSLAILLVSVIFWSILGAHLQQTNADQLVSPYLFNNAATFHGAIFPGQHSFLIKWPLFYLIKLFGYSAGAYTAITVGAVLLTVLVLVIVIYAIEKRPLYFGSLCLALASVLILIPAQPYPGGLLPVNMAMLTTRNLEYALYIVSLIFFVRLRRIKSWGFVAAVLLSSILIASDKLFLTIGVGSALVALIFYALAQRNKLVYLSANWLAGEILAGIIAVGILALINISKITHIASQASAGPFPLIHNLHELGLGIFYAIANLFTNFGANPAFAATTVKGIPSQLSSHIFSIGGFSFIINALILIGGCYAVFYILKSSVVKKSVERTDKDHKSSLAIMLIFSTLIAFVAFVASYHDYVVDARYLTIALFALFAASAVYISKHKWNNGYIVVAGLIFIVAVALGAPAAAKINSSEIAALKTVNQQNTTVADALKNHPVNTLVGDYWRVVPIKVASDNRQQITPLTGCLQDRSDLTSSAWEPNLNKNSFAYLLSYSENLTNFPSCSLNEIIKGYGRPNSSALIAGSETSPKEQLLFYDHGANDILPSKSEPTHNPSTVLPISLSDLTYTSCPVPTVMTIVAHEDDDLLFMNPDILNDIKAGYCMRTVFVTAGNAGYGEFYWLAREQGSEAAYSKMIGSTAVWIEHIVELNNHEFITVANPKGDSKISLIFMHLPDGNLKGQGFISSNFESLAKLKAGTIPVLNSVDGQSTYTSKQLVNTLETLMNTYSPTDIYTQSTYPGTKFPDHSDHNNVGQFVKLAYAQYEKDQYDNQVIIPIKFYMGYPVRQFPTNVGGTNLQEKESIFLTYAQHDGSVCQSVADCNQSPEYNGYLTREYQNSY